MQEGRCEYEREFLVSVFVGNTQARRRWSARTVGRVIKSWERNRFGSLRGSLGCHDEFTYSNRISHLGVFNDAFPSCVPNTPKP